MDTRGHESCAKIAGEELLRAALRRAGRDGWNLQAFYFGNWLTDVCQAVDPVAYAGLHNKVLGGFDTLTGWIQPVCDLIRAIPAVGDTARKIVDHLDARRREIDGFLDILLRCERNGLIKDAMTKAMLVKGYYKFSHPKHEGEPLRLKYSIFKRIFTERFTQYFPHEHLDRFPGELDLAGGYANKVVRGTRTVVSPPGTGGNANPHLYHYLVDDLEMAAGLFAEIDLTWARHTFLKKSSKFRNDLDEDWNLGLAALGHALHACEDFFAHSNFIEHAVDRLGRRDAFLRSIGIDPDDDGSLSPHNILRRRLKKLTGRRTNEWTYDSSAWFYDWKKAPDEPDVVTGYFDITDTIFSLRHVAEELFGGEGGGHAAHVEEGVHFTELFSAMCEGIHKESAGQPMSRDQARNAAERLLKQYAVSHPDADVRRAAQITNDKLPAESAEIRAEFLDAVALFTQTGSRVPGSLYSALMFAMRFQALLLTISAFVDQFKPKLPWLSEWWDDNISKPVKRAVDDAIGRYRLGCHSLLAKDYEVANPALDQLWSRAKHCATAVHWYIIKTITRWSEPLEVAMCRAEHDEATAVNTCDTHRYIDWLELVEFFHRHPHGGYSNVPEKQRWWHPIVEHNNWEKFPGYTGVRPERDGRLPHRLVYMRHEADVNDMIACAKAMRKAAEEFYNQSLKTPLPPPPRHRAHKRTREVPPEPPAPPSPPPMPPGLTAPPSGGGRAAPPAYLPDSKAVRDLQSALIELGFNPGVVDGHWGPNTRAALCKFQEANPPLVVDGVYGPKSRDALHLALGN